MDDLQDPDADTEDESPVATIDKAGKRSRGKSRYPHFWIFWLFMFMLHILLRTHGHHNDHISNLSFLDQFLKLHSS